MIQDRLAVICRTALLLLLALETVPVAASQSTHRASLTVAVESGRVLHAWHANRPLAPASLTKLMTIYLVLEALAQGKLDTSTRWTVSAHAAAQPPSRFGLREGEQLDVATVLAALVVVSANDAAMLAAESLGGSESRFVEAMNATARALGMNDTVFRTPSGLPAEGQRTTARDIAVLARTLWQKFPDQASLFSRLEVEFDGRRQRTINGFLTRYRGADGMKTGFTCRAGFNLVASAQRGSRRVVGVVMGAPSPEDRERVMQALMDRALLGGASSRDPLDSLDALARRSGQGRELALETSIVARSCLGPGARARGPSGWSIDVGVERDRGAARRTARRFIRDWLTSLGGGQVLIIPRFTGVNLYRSLVTGLSQERARDTCLAFRKTGGDCVILDTPVARAQLARARQVEELGRRTGSGNGLVRAE